MTKTQGVLTPPHGSAVEQKQSGSCKRCEVIRTQAEKAFTELRAQTDAHIAAVQRKLKEDNGAELQRLFLENQQMSQELKTLKESTVPKEQALKLEHETRLRQQSSMFEKKLSEVSSDYEARIAKVQSQLEEAQRHGLKEMETLSKSHRKEIALLESRLKQICEENESFAIQIQKSEIEIHSLRSQNNKSQIHADRATHTIAAERDSAVEQVAALKLKISSLESGKTESDLERAKLDLAYRRRIGEMESEVRRTEIESVRLRREILQLTQRIEQLETEGGYSSWLARGAARSRVLPIESGIPSLNSGRITRVGSPSVPSRKSDVEEVSSPTCSN